MYSANISQLLYLINCVAFKDCTIALLSCNKHGLFLLCISTYRITRTITRHLFTIIFLFYSFLVHQMLILHKLNAFVLTSFLLSVLIAKRMTHSEAILTFLLSVSCFKPNQVQCVIHWTCTVGRVKKKPVQRGV